MYSRVPECQVTTYYYVGFAYLMMRRYQDAIRVFANILLYIQRTKSMFQRTTYKYEMVRDRIGLGFPKEKPAVFFPAPPLSPDNLHLIVQPYFPRLCCLVVAGDPLIFFAIFTIFPLSCVSSFFGCSPCSCPGSICSLTLGSVVNEYQLRMVLLLMLLQTQSYS